MNAITSSPPKDWKEGRRLRAWELKQKGWKQRDIAEALGVSEGAVSQWMKRVREGGVEALRRVPPPGAPPRLTEAQRASLLELLGRGPKAFGFPGDVWTCGCVAALIERQFGVSYHPAHISRLLKVYDWMPLPSSKLTSAP